MSKDVTLRIRDPATGENYKPVVPIWFLWVLYDCTYRLGATKTAILLALGHVILRRENDHEPQLHQDITLVEAMLEVLINMTSLEEQLNDRDERLMGFTYGLLRWKELTHTEAAQFASVILGESLKRDAWRMRLNRWIKKHNLPKIEQRQRQPRTVTNENG